MSRLYLLLSFLMLLCSFTAHAEPHFEISLPQQTKTTQFNVVDSKQSFTVQAAPVKRQSVVPLKTSLPASVVIMKKPTAVDFLPATAPNKTYQFYVPKAFGKDPLDGMQLEHGTMLTRISSDTLYCAAQIMADEYTTGYKSGVPLPDFPAKTVLLTWKHDSRLHWQCIFSKHTDFFGNKYILQCRTMKDGKTCQLLYVFPKDKLNEYLPLALYSLNSFTLLQT